jgi:hypothetical protein
VIEDQIDYVCFTDTPENIPDIWETRKLSAAELSNKLKSGKVKTQPHEFFPEYEQSVWIDANIGMCGRIHPYITNLLEQTSLAVPKHPTRDCIYDEAQTCVNLAITEEKETKKLTETYRSEGFPRNFGLSETRLLIRRHNDEHVVRTMDTWWKKYRNGPERDQLSFDYACWKENIDYEFLPSHITTESKYFKRFLHKGDTISESIYEYLLRYWWRSTTKFRIAISFTLLKLYMILDMLVGYPVNALNILIYGGPKRLIHELDHKIVR